MPLCTRDVGLGQYVVNSVTTSVVMIDDSEVGVAIVVLATLVEDATLVWTLVIAEVVRRAVVRGAVVEG